MLSPSPPPVPPSSSTAEEEEMRSPATAVREGELIGGGGNEQAPPTLRQQQPNEEPHLQPLPPPPTHHGEQQQLSSLAHFSSCLSLSPTTVTTNSERKRPCSPKPLPSASEPAADDESESFLNKKRLKLSESGHTCGVGENNDIGSTTFSSGHYKPIFSRGGHAIPASQNEVFITQPYSLPASPIPSAGPRQTLSTTSSPSTINWVSENLAVVRSRASNNSTTSPPLTSSSRDTSVQDWQALKTGVRERNAAMCNNDLMADVTFIVSSNGCPISVTFPAHKYVLATGSSVFYAMFYGSLAEQSVQIVVPDVEPDAFLKMLKYLYADEIDLDEDSVLPTLHVAKKYIIPYLAKACVQYMEASLTARNACILLCQSRIFDEPDLMQRCWEVIDAQAELALNSEGFTDIDHSTLKEILSRETLNCKEVAVFEAAMAWGCAECERQELQPTPENLRMVLGNALELIRVLTMELGEFADGPAQVGIFSLEECHDMFLHFTASVKPKLAYPTIPRAGLKPQVCHRFQSSAYRSNQWRYRGRCDSIQFLVDRRIFIVGFGLYGSSTGATTYGVHIELKRQGRALAENNTEFFSDGSSNTFHVYFQQPVQIDPDIFYTASAILDGMELSYFGQEGMADVSVSNVSFQFQCSSESTNGTGVQGGQIPELIFYGPAPPHSQAQSLSQQENNNGNNTTSSQV